MAADETGGACNQNGDAAEAGCAIHEKDTGPILLREVGQFEIGVVSLAASTKEHWPLINAKPDTDGTPSDIV
jgi:hypothetical protein